MEQFYTPGTIKDNELEYILSIIDDNIENDNPDNILTTEQAKFLKDTISQMVGMHSNVATLLVGSIYQLINPIDVILMQEKLKDLVTNCAKRALINFKDLI